MQRQLVLRKQVDRRIEEGFLPHLCKEGEQLSLSEILHARRHGKTSSNNDTNSSCDLKNRRQGVPNQGADYDDVDYCQNSGQPRLIVRNLFT